MTISEAVKQARGNAHGSYNYDAAKQVLVDAYRRATGNPNPSLDQLWAWVDGYMEMESASYGPIPLG